MKKLIIPILITLILVSGVGGYFLGRAMLQKALQAKEENYRKSADAAKEIAIKYFSAYRFNDFGGAYALTCPEFKLKVPEKNFFEFAMNSSLLERPGDGDCDVQNQQAMVCFRALGIPARLNFVITENGAGHGPGEVFFPGVGWVEMDTMGEIIIREKQLVGDVDSRASLNGAAVDLDAELRRQADWMKRGC